MIESEMIVVVFDGEATAIASFFMEILCLIKRPI